MAVHEVGCVTYCLVCGYGCRSAAGAKSNEDLLNDTALHNASSGEKDSISSSGSLHLQSGIGMAYRGVS